MWHKHSYRKYHNKNLLSRYPNPCKIGVSTSCWLQRSFSITFMFSWYGLHSRILLSLILNLDQTPLKHVQKLLQSTAAVINVALQGFFNITVNGAFLPIHFIYLKKSVQRALEVSIPWEVLSECYWKAFL